MTNQCSLLFFFFVAQVFMAVNVAGNNDDISTFDFLQPIMIREYDDSSQRQLLNRCIGPGGRPHYFEVTIRLIPSAPSAGKCDSADQVYLGNAINSLLFDYGVGEAGADDDAIYLANVCPEPKTTVRRELLGATAFVWMGGGGCRFCLTDNRDKRVRGLIRGGGGVDGRDLQIGAQDNWFEDTFKVETEATLESAILQELAPKHQSCLGLTPTVEVTIVEITMADLRKALRCDDGTVVEALQAMNLQDIPVQTNSCGTCVSLDFSKKGNGDVLAKGDYVKDEWKTQYNLTVTASGGFSPGSKARILDTGDAECIGVDGSRDFGSPNQACAGGGLGVGNGGVAGTSGANCIPLGNVLIVQDKNKTCPDASKNGGHLTFYWDNPVMISDIGLMDIDESNQRVRFTYGDGYVETFSFPGYGDNAVQRVIANKLNVVKLELIFPGTAAVTELNFCPQCIVDLQHDEDNHCLSVDDALIMSEEVLAFDNFEGSSPLSGWTNGILESGETASFTKFLGRFDSTNSATYKTFSVPRNAEAVVFMFDFYEIDGWNSSSDSAVIYIDGEKIDLGYFGHSLNEDRRSGTTQRGLRWNCNTVDIPSNLGFNGAYPDQKHRVSISVPRASNMFGDGKLRLSLTVQLGSDNSIASAGWDNIYVLVRLGCDGQVISSNSIIPVEYVGYNAKSISVGSDGKLGVANILNEMLLKNQNDTRWSYFPIVSQVADLAVVEDNKYWAIGGTDSRIYRWNGALWIPSSYLGAAVATNSAGDVALIALTIGIIYYKTGFNDSPNWSLIPGVFYAKDVAFVQGTILYYIARNNLVYRTTDWKSGIKVGHSATKISASTDGTVVIVGTDGTLWQKRYDDDSEDWVQIIVPGKTVIDVAVKNFQTIYITDSELNVFRVSIPPVPALAPLPVTTNATHVGRDARTISVGSDGTLATVKQSNDMWVSTLGNGWSLVSGRALIDVGVVGPNKYYAIGTDQNVYQWNGAGWNFIFNSQTNKMGVSSDGTIVAIKSGFYGTAQFKTNLYGAGSWLLFGGVLYEMKDVAPVGGGIAYYIASDSFVYRTTSYTVKGIKVWSQAATKISAGADGTVAAVTPNGQVWRKRRDDNRDSWDQVPGISNAVDIAVLDRYTIFISDSSNNIYRHSIGMRPLSATEALVRSNTLRASIGINGTLVAIGIGQEMMVSYLGTTFTPFSTAKVIDVGIVGPNKYYSIGTDKKVYRWNGSSWVYISGFGVDKMAASPDGTVAIINEGSGVLYYKIGYDDTGNWALTASQVLTAKDVAFGFDNVMYYVLSDGTVWRTSVYNEKGFQIGHSAEKISVGRDGTVMVVSINGNLWQKTRNDGEWLQIQGVKNVVDVTVYDAETIFVTRSDKVLYRIYPST